MRGPDTARADAEKWETPVMSTALVIAITLCLSAAVLSSVMVQKKKQQ